MVKTRRYRVWLRLCTLGIFGAVLIIGIPVAATGPFQETTIVILHEFHGETIGDGFGWVGANLGDLDGDGATDFATTAPFYGGEHANGKLYVYSGQTGRLLNEVVGIEGNRLGYSISSAGDVNSDGTADYIVGGSGPANRVVVYSGVDHTMLHDLTTPSAERENFGASVAGAGDVNGDGYADLLVGANRADVSATITDTGRIYLLSGSDGSVIWQQMGSAPQGMLGSGLGLVGDVNADGIPDQVAAAPGAGPHGLGEAYVFSGMDGATLYTLRPMTETTSGGTFGTFFAAGAGDSNADGTPDIFIGDYAAVRGTATDTGRAYLYSGSDGTLLHTFEAEADGDGIGPGRGIPDIDSDGYADVILAAWQSSAASPKGGKVYLYSGKDMHMLQTVTGTIAQDALGVDALSVGDVNGDGTMDYMLTAVGNDFAGTDVGHVYIVTFQKKAATVTLQPILAGCQPIRPE